MSGYIPWLYVQSGLGRIAGRCLTLGMHGAQEGDDGGDLRRAEVPAVRRHVAAALDDLPHELVAGQTRCRVVEGWSTLPAFVAERMAVAALLALDQQRALQLQRRATLDIFDRRGRAAPRFHVRRPRRESPEPGERTDDEEGQDDDDDGHRPPPIRLLAGA